MFDSRRICTGCQVADGRCDQSPARVAICEWEEQHPEGREEWEPDPCSERIDPLMENMVLADAAEDTECDPDPFEEVAA